VLTYIQCLFTFRICEKYKKKFKMELKLIKTFILTLIIFCIQYSYILITSSPLKSGSFVILLSFIDSNKNKCCFNRLSLREKEMAFFFLVTGPIEIFRQMKVELSPTIDFLITTIV
jgi:hypothetical protein